MRQEIEAEIKRTGRISLIDLSDVIGVDLYHVEKQAQEIVGRDSGLMIVNGEIILDSYWDSAAEEIDEKLQECSQIALAEIAAQLQAGSELVVSILEPRIGSIVSSFVLYNNALNLLDFLVVFEIAEKSNKRSCLLVLVSVTMRQFGQRGGG